MPALGVSLILIAIGAILAFGVTATFSGISITAIGVVLMAVGALGILLSLLFLMSFSPWGGGGTTIDTHTHDHV
jgi:hypothetical protein